MVSQLERSEGPATPIGCGRPELGDLFVAVRRLCSGRRISSYSRRLTLLLINGRASSNTSGKWTGGVTVMASGDEGRVFVLRLSVVGDRVRRCVWGMRLWLGARWCCCTAAGPSSAVNAAACDCRRVGSAGPVDRPREAGVRRKMQWWRPKSSNFRDVSTGFGRWVRLSRGNGAN
jgi:hypothetical protein